MADVITRKRTVIDSAQWIDSSNGEIVEAVRLEHIDAVPAASLTAAVAHAREMEGQVEAMEKRGDKFRDECDRIARERDAAEKQIENARVEIRCRKLPVREDRPLFEYVDAAIDYVIEQKEAAETRAREAETGATTSARILVESQRECDALRAKLEEAEKASETWRSRIATAVGAVHEWDYGSAPGTWEQIESLARDTSKQAMHDAEVWAEQGEQIEALQSRLARFAALERAARKLSKDCTPADYKALSAALDALTQPAREQVESVSTPAADKPATCGECLSLTQAGSCWDKSSMRYGETRDEAEPACPAFTRRLPVVAETEHKCGGCEYFNGSMMCLKFTSNTAVYAKACPEFVAKVVDAKWRCGKCEGAEVPMHSRHCYKRYTCNDCSVFDRLDRERICKRAECNVNRLDPACPAFTRRLPVVEEPKRECATCKHSHGDKCTDPEIGPCHVPVLQHWQPRPAAGEEVAK